MKAKIQTKKKLNICGWVYIILTVVCIVAVIFTAVACYDKPIDLETPHFEEAVWLYLSIMGFLFCYTLTAKSVFKSTELDIQGFLDIINLIAVAVIPFLKLSPALDIICETILYAIVTLLAFRQVNFKHIFRKK